MHACNSASNSEFLASAVGIISSLIISFANHVQLCYIGRKSMNSYRAWPVLCVLAFFGRVAPSPSALPEVRFQFRGPQPMSYRVQDSRSALGSGGEAVEWIKARPDDGSTNQVELSRRVVLQVKSASDLGKLLRESPLHLARSVTENIFILQANDVWSALAES